MSSELHLSRASDDTLLVRLAGDWKIGHQVPSTTELVKQMESEPPPRIITFDTRELTGWDSTLLTFLIKLTEHGAKNNIELDTGGLPPGVQRLLALASAVPEKAGARRVAKRLPFLALVGTSSMKIVQSTTETLAFIGETVLATFRLLRGRAQFRRSDFWLTIQECGVQALPIVGLISLLFGLILAFVGAVQLLMFGAEIYVASLVGIGIVRVMGAVMTGIIMAGRTGAAFAAQLGTMQVNEEIDALKTMGISPMEFLVLPRMLALALMMPLLCIYADLVGILGGLIVGVGMLDINLTAYINQTRASVGLTNFWIGLFHSFVFGILVALTGCLQGIKCGRSASAVGQATTRAVVNGIVSIVVATAIITVVCNVLRI